MTAKSIPSLLFFLYWQQLKSLLACCCRRKKFFQNAAKMIGPWQLLALRENETAMDVSTTVICMHSVQHVVRIVWCRS